MVHSNVASLFVPVRFMLLWIHMFATFVLATATENSIKVSIYPSNNPAKDKEKIDLATATLSAWIGVAAACSLVEFASMVLLPYSMSSPLISCISTALHFIGAGLTYFMIFEGWHYNTYASICLFTSLLPFLLEMSLDSTFCCTWNRVRNVTHCLKGTFGGGKAKQ